MDLAGAVAKKRSVLVLATVAENTFPETDGLYLFLPHSWNRPVFYADEEAKKIYNEKGAAIKSYAELLARIEEQCQKEAGLKRRYWPGLIVEKQIGAEWGSDATRELYAGSAVLISTLEYQEPTK